MQEGTSDKPMQSYPPWFVNVASSFGWRLLRFLRRSGSVLLSKAMPPHGRRAQQSALQRLWSAAWTHRPDGLQEGASHPGGFAIGVHLARPHYAVFTWQVNRLWTLLLPYTRGAMASETVLGRGDSPLGFMMLVDQVPNVIAKQPRTSLRSLTHEALPTGRPS